MRRETHTGDSAKPSIKLPSPESVLLSRPSALRRSALRKGTGIPPAHILFEERRLKTATRISRLDCYHPLRIRAMGVTDSVRHRLILRTGNRDRLGLDRVHDSRVQRMFQLLSDTKLPPPLQLPVPAESKFCLSSKGDAVNFITQWLTTLPSDCLCTYSDGSGASTDCI